MSEAPPSGDQPGDPPGTPAGGEGSALDGRDARSTSGVARAGEPSGSSRSEEGAVTAAVAFATASQRWLYRTDQQVASEVAEVTTGHARERLTNEILDKTRDARERLRETSGRIWWLVRPLAWRVERFSPDEAEVSVWLVSVLSAAGVAAPQAEWTTVTLDLRWVGPRWRVDAVSDTPGPTPMTGPHDEPWNAEPFDEALEGFTRVSGEKVS